MNYYTIHNTELLWEELQKLENKIISNRDCMLLKLRNLKYLVQNEGVTISERELEEWFLKKASLKSDMSSTELATLLESVVFVLGNNLHPADK
jgi:hypothetical protein